MTHWRDNDAEAFSIPDHVQDLAFRIRAESLPLDHASALCAALTGKLPWLVDEPRAAIHLVHYPESGSGWQRDEDDPGTRFFVSNRSRLKLRLPKHRMEGAHVLSGQTLDVGGDALEIGAGHAMPLGKTDTLYARRVIQHDDETEAAFLERMIARLHELGIDAPKAVCGKTRNLARPGGGLTVRSLMLAGLSFGDALRLQETGLGDGRLFGCGIFVPHKSIGGPGGD